MRFSKVVQHITVQFWIWSEAQGTACRLSYSGITFVGGYPPPNSRGEEIGPPQEVGPAGRNNACR